MEGGRHCAEAAALYERAATLCVLQCFQSNTSSRRLLWEHRLVECLKNQHKQAGLAVAHLTAINSPQEKHKEDKAIWADFEDRLEPLKTRDEKVDINDGALKDDESTLRSAETIICALIESIPRLSVLFDPSENGGLNISLEPVFADLMGSKKFKKHQEHTTSKLDYRQYLQTTLRDPSTIPRHCKYNEITYKSYLENLVQYLDRFYQKLNPLQSLKQSQSISLRLQIAIQAETIIQRIFNSQNPTLALKHETNTQSILARDCFTLLQSWLTPTIDFETYALATDMLFATSVACQTHKNSAKYQKAENALKNDQVRIETIKKQSKKNDVLIASLECVAVHFATLLSSVIDRSCEAFDMRESQAHARVQTETQAEIDADADDDDLNEQIAEALGLNTAANASEPVGSGTQGVNGVNGAGLTANPLRLPIGWDGKPIPVWLYKLHGLSREFRCEICGDFVYYGRKNFEMHFHQWRHAYGMKCLGLPNSSEFKEVTSIADALQLYKELKKKADDGGFIPERDIELEDAFGNPITAQQYLELKQTGAL